MPYRRKELIAAVLIVACVAVNTAVNIVQQRMNNASIRQRADHEVRIKALETRFPAKE